MPKVLFPSHFKDLNLQESFPDNWNQEFKEYARLWLKDLQSGSRPTTPATIQTFHARFVRYTRHFDKPTLSIQDCLEPRSIYSYLCDLPIESFSNRHNTYYAIYSFARFLLRFGVIEESYISKLKQLRPKRVFPAKKTSLRDEAALKQFNSVITRKHFHSDWSYMIVKTVIETLLQTGLRNGELCRLKFEDVDLKNQELKVFLGKGRKNRIIGISNNLIPYLEEYLRERLLRFTDSPYFFLNSCDIPFYPGSLAAVIKRISDLSGVPVTTHGLRRTFATIKAEEAKPLHLIQLALGHSDIKTTQSYLMTDQKAVAEAMKDW
jgi:integrase